MAGLAKRNESSTAIKKVEGVDPSFLTQYVAEDQSLSGMDEYRILPRLKVIQGLSDSKLKDAFGEGSAVIRPGDALVFDLRKADAAPFMVVPHLFFVEFAKWADRRDKDSPMVVERSFDPNSMLAKIARDPEKRFEVYKGHESKKNEQDKWKFRYVEHLRFPSVLYGDHPLAGTPVVISFERGEFGVGKNFISGIKLRRQRVEVNGQSKNIPVPLWAQVWAFKTSIRERNGNKWFGLDPITPEGMTMIKPEEAEDMNRAHVDLKTIHEQNRLRVDEVDNDGTEDPAAVPEAKDRQL